MNFPFSKFHKTIFLISVVFFLVLVIKLSPLNSSKGLTPQKSLKTYAREVVETCKKEEYRPTCYEEEIPNLMDKISMEEAFEVTKLVQKLDKEYAYCHVVGHELSALETKKNPDKWKEVIGKCPSGVCSNGCIHGAFQERFRAESLPDTEIAKLKTELNGVCELREGFQPTSLEQATCYHALGHLTMYITEADIDKSLGLCSELAITKEGKDFSPLCFDGVFMQIYQPLDPDDFALIAGQKQTKETVEGFCSNYLEEQFASCWSESWPLFWQEIKKDPDQLIRFCSHLPNGLTKNCLRDIFYVITALFQFDIEKISNYCLNLPFENQGFCFANAASRMIETDYRNSKASISICENAPQEQQEECFRELLFYASYNFHKNSQEQNLFCANFPDKWRLKCP